MRLETWYDFHIKSSLKCTHNIFDNSNALTKLNIFLDSAIATHFTETSSTQTIAVTPTNATTPKSTVFSKNYLDGLVLSNLSGFLKTCIY